tara:strand:- start:1946 stop:2515 length:570 start_codon:yes stop_codon:yes gene_type:complete
MANKRDLDRALARRVGAVRRNPTYQQKTTSIPDMHTQEAVNEIWEVLDALQDKMLKPAMPKTVRKARGLKIGKITSNIGSMRVKEKGDGFGSNNVEIMGKDNWKQMSAKLPITNDLTIVPVTTGTDGAGIDTGTGNDGTEVVTEVNISWMNAQIDRVAELEKALNKLLSRINNKDIFDMIDADNEVDQG